MESKNKSLRWVDYAVVYQIYPRSFKDGNHDGIGDLPGITSKLDYLNGTKESLGINAVWLSPFYRSPMKDFGYDVSDYCQVDPIFGTNEDFDQLIAEAHKRNIKVMIDFIPNHTSDQHEWFVESKKDRSNPKREWYIWKDPSPAGGPPNNWLSVFGGSAWEFDQETGQYYLHSFLKEQPDLNWRNLEVVEAMKEVLCFWLDKGVDGFRIDVLDFIIKDEQFRDELPNPDTKTAQSDRYLSLLHTYSRSQPETFEIVNDLANLVQSYGDKFIVSELVDMDIAQMVTWYQAAANNLHAPFNFKFIWLPWEIERYSQFLSEYDNALNPEHVPTYVLGNHDVPRPATRFGPEKARLAAMLLLTLRGMPFVYYGDELGMENGEIPFEKRQDPFGKDDPNTVFTRDPERTPMQWDRTLYAGFSEHEPWLPVNETFQEVNVDKELQEPDSMLNLYRRLIQLRKDNTALRDGKYVAIQHPTILAYLRQSEAQKILMLLNFEESDQEFVMPIKGSLLCSTHTQPAANSRLNGEKLLLRKYQGVVIELDG